MHPLLLVDDDTHELRALSITPPAYGHSVLTCPSGAEAVHRVATNRPDLVLLDLELPDMDGTAVIRTLRANSDVLIIVLSGRHDPTTKTDALNRGAHDYITTPFCIDELHARIRAALRRSRTSPLAYGGMTHRIGDWLVDVHAHAVTAAAGDCRAAPRLTPKEWRLLQTLLNRPGVLVGAGQLLTAVWGPGHEHSTNYLRTYFCQLRSTLERDPSRPRHLITEPGMGRRYLP